MAYKVPDDGGADPLEAMRRALAAAQAAGTAGPTGTTQATPTSTYADENPLTGSWSGDSPNPTNTSAYGGYDMGALRRQADALGRAADEANGNVRVESRTTQPTGSQYLPGTEPTPYSPAPIPPQSIPQQTTAIQRALAGGSSTGQSDLSTAATGGSLPNAPKVQPPTTVPTTTTGVSGTSDLLAKMTTGIDQGPKTTGDSALARAAAGGAGAGLSGAGSSSLDQGGSGGGDLGALTNSILGQLQGIGQSLAAPGNAPDVGGVFMQQAQAILKMLDDQEAQLRSESEKSGTTIDPATQFTIDKIREGLEENLKTTREDLNRRGVYDSGITLDLEGKLRKGSASDQAQILSSRLSKLQDQLAQGLSTIRSSKVNTLQSFGRDAAQANFTAGENAKRNAYDREQAALQGMLNLRGQVSGEQNAAANRSFQGQESALSRAFNAEQADLDRQYGDAQNRAKTAAEFEQNRIAYEREKALIDQRAAAGVYTSGGGSGGGGSVRPAAAAATGAQGSITDQAIADLKSVFTNSSEANAAIKEQMRELAEAGVDIAKLFDAAAGLGGRRVGTAGY